jgi:hypothetical protein
MQSHQQSLSFQQEFQAAVRSFKRQRLGQTFSRPERTPAFPTYGIYVTGATDRATLRRDSTNRWTTSAGNQSYSHSTCVVTLWGMDQSDHPEFDHNWEPRWPQNKINYNWEPRWPQNKHVEEVSPHVVQSTSMNVADSPPPPPPPDSHNWEPRWPQNKINYNWEPRWPQNKHVEEVSPHVVQSTSMNVADSTPPPPPPDSSLM